MNFIGVIEFSFTMSPSWANVTYHSIDSIVVLIPNSGIVNYSLSISKLS